MPVNTTPTAVYGGPSLQAVKFEVVAFTLTAPPTGVPVLTVGVVAENADGSASLRLPDTAVMGAALAGVLYAAATNYETNIAAGQSKPAALQLGIKQALYTVLQAMGTIPAGTVS